MAQKLVFTALAAILPLVAAQQIGTQTPEVHPKLPTWKCTTGGGCVQQDTSIVLDWGYHPIHKVNSQTSCTTSSGVDATLCPNEVTCAANCAIEGANYAGSGVTTSGNAVTLKQYVQNNGVTTNASPRIYLLGSDGNYEMLHLLGQELRFDVDASTLGNSCDSSGCGFNPYAQGLHNYYGNGGTVDTLKPITVITQFYTNDNTQTGTLTEIRRLYIQNGKVIQNAVTSSGMDSIKAAWCSSSDAAAARLGGLTTMGQALGRGMVLIFSIWNDAGQHMSWLDSGSSGPCSSSEGNPTNIQQQTPGTYVTFSNIRWGDIGSTFSESGG
ncbi:hypothetical protein VE01_10684 [Pseudogymnoascus verrucosus]|uniref:Glucanase n=1 Tax=Pseudogymnoascus verrucosus TaxID=342668 RepID=A0A1B8G656_9PEZI|nr:uncharacterized protein VE01_10684 [Pseudogymnoascus verrucosus]OBT91317.1 hypothetical protein VE01_10684 [Pseudogymnoascus verrucosus]